ncbi:MAG: shikimate dehydrogenase [Candidatus Micrarchaeia archaeon]
MARTRIFASTGKPIMHSISPQMHNAAFHELGMDAVYIRLAAANADAALLAARQIGMDGLNVTTPYKEEFVRLMDNVDESAASVGAVNTVKLEKGKATGFNTDGNGVSGALIGNGIEISGKKAVVLGAGGAAMAAVNALCSNGAEVIVANRTHRKAKALAERFGCGACSLEEKELGAALDGADIVVSALSTHERVVPRGMLGKNTVVLEAIYAKGTALAADAKENGCRVLEGREWLLWQGVKAFEIFTGSKAPEKAMQAAIAKKEAHKGNIALVGFMGSGKSRIAREISKLAGMERIDTDEKIREIAGKSINDIFKQDGERAFRELERQAIANLQGVHGNVISCGGGAVLDSRNVAVLKENCTIVWLWASEEETCRRLEGEKGRPLLDAKDRKERIGALLAERIPAYATCADLVVGTEGMSANDVAKLIIDETGIAGKN